MERKKEESKHQTDFSCSEGNRSGQTSVKSLRWKFPKCECLLKITDETKRKACVKANYRTPPIFFKQMLTNRVCSSSAYFPVQLCITTIKLQLITKWLRKTSNIYCRISTASKLQNYKYKVKFHVCETHPNKAIMYLYDFYSSSVLNSLKRSDEFQEFSC